MTNRIAMAILMTVWAILLLAGTIAYFVTRSILLASLDAALVSRAASLPELTDINGRQYRAMPSLRNEDRYLVRDEHNRTISRPSSTRPVEESSIDPATIARQQPQLISSAFTRLPDGTRIRTVTLAAFGTPLDHGSDAKLARVTVIFR